MTSTIVFFILAVIKSNIVWTTAIPSNIHEMMTPEEISQTFNTDDGSVPDYQVLSMVLPGARRRREADDEIHTIIEMYGMEFLLTFKRTAGYLATRYTPVWLAVTDQEAYNQIRYDPLPNAMEDIGEFKIYQDVQHEAAIVVYADPDRGEVIEGILSSTHVMRSLPIRLMNQTSNGRGNNSDQVRLLRKRSIEPDTDEITSYYVLYKSPLSPKNAKRNVYTQVKKRQRYYKRRRRYIPEAVYPEILLVLDHNAIRNHTITQALRFMLAFWNSVDMVYAALDNPRVYLNIAGIIISADDAATPYIAEDTSIPIKPHSDLIIRELAKYFAKEIDRFPLGQYDMIVAMTSIHLCREETDPCNTTLGIASSKTACTPARQASQIKKINGVAVVYYDWMFSGVETATHESAHLFGVDHDEGENAMAECLETRGYVMAQSNGWIRQRLKFSSCSKKYLRNYFSLRESQCLDNTPMWITPVEEVLPGRWLTLDGQCRNSGYHKTCQIRGMPVCMIKGCRAKYSDECELSKHVPLPGTKCGENKYCKSGPGCVDE